MASLASAAFQKVRTKKILRALRKLFLESFFRNSAAFSIGIIDDYLLAAGWKTSESRQRNLLLGDLNQSTPEVASMKKSLSLYFEYRLQSFQT